MRQNVLVFSIAMNGYQWLYRSLRDSHQAYADAHGYQYVQVTRPASSLLGMEIAWLKINLALKSLQSGYDWVVFLDADTQVSPTAPAVETLEKEGKYLYAASGFSGRLNSGVMIMKNHHSVARYLQRALAHAEQPVEVENEVGWGENGHLIQYAQHASFVQFIHHRWNNNQDPNMDDFIRHYSRGPMQALFTPSVLDKVLFRIHFHAVCKTKKWLGKGTRQPGRFHATLAHLTDQVIKRYPAIVKATALMARDQDIGVAVDG